MYTDLFHKFQLSDDTLWVYEDNLLVFSSNKEQLIPLLEYLDRFSPNHPIIFDRVMGNAAALLSVKAGGQEVYSPLGSELAVQTLDKYSVKYHLTQIVPCIQRADGKEMCPMEKLSVNREPEEFYQLLKKRAEGKMR